MKTLMGDRRQQIRQELAMQYPTKKMQFLTAETPQTSQRTPMRSIKNTLFLMGALLEESVNKVQGIQKEIRTHK